MNNYWCQTDETKTVKKMETDETPTEKYWVAKMDKELLNNGSHDQSIPQMPMLSPEPSFPPPPATLQSEVRYDRRIQSKEKPFKCQSCPSVFSFASNLSRHKKNHTEKRPSAFSMKSNVNTHKRNHKGEKLWKCETCSSPFFTERALNKHRKRHTGVVALKCEACPSYFNDEISLTKHFQTQHEKKSNVCEICAAVCASKSHLDIHMRIHTGEKPFACNKCSSAFNHRGHLITHMRVHTGEKPYECEICHAAFSVSSNLHRHKRTHHPYLPSKLLEPLESYSRPSPDPASYSRATSQKISDSHNGLKQLHCDICLSYFKDEQILLKHMNEKHKTVETSWGKTFECYFCPLNFVNETSLKLHTKFIHTGVGQ